jgi:hypothetical protein
MEAIKRKDFWAATAILILTVIVMATVIFHWVNIGFYIGPFRLNHWFVLIGATYIALGVPTIATLKKRIPKRYASLYTVHVFGNLLAFMLISLHFASQISRPADSFPELGTGVVLYIPMILLVGTGFIQRFQLLSKINPRYFRFIHTSSAFAFYLIIIVHILHGLAIL